MAGAAASGGVDLGTSTNLQLAPTPPSVSGPSEAAGPEETDERDERLARGCVDPEEWHRHWNGNAWHDRRWRGNDRWKSSW